MATNSKPRVSEELVSLLERLCLEEGSFRRMATKAGIKSPDVFARVVRREGSLKEETARKLYAAYGMRAGVSLSQIMRWARLPDPEPDGTESTGQTWTAGPHPAPPYFTMLLPTGVAPSSGRWLEPSPWVGMQTVALVTQRIHAGQTQPYADDPPTLPVNVPRPGRYLAMRVVGDCMTPDIEPGDIVILDQEMAVLPDWVAAVAIEGETLLTRMIRRDADEWEFAADNPATPSLIVPTNSIAIIGVVIARQKGAPVRRSPRIAT